MSFLLCVPALGAPYRGSNRGVSVFLEGQPIDYVSAAPFFENNTVYVPIKETIAHFGGTLTWDSRTQQIFLIDGTDQREIDSSYPFFERNGTTFGPVRWAADHYRLYIRWDAADRAVYLSASPIPEPLAKNYEVPILMYHEIKSDDHENSVVSPESFARQMAYLHDHGYTTLTDQDVIHIREGRLAPPDKPVMITFDDGYEGVYKNAFPVLEQYRMKASLYLIVSRVREEDIQYPDYVLNKHLAWGQIKDMYDTGLFSFQSHTYDSHVKGEAANGKEQSVLMAPIYQSDKLETEAEYERRVKDDLTKSKDIIERKLGATVDVFCYPYGQYSAASEKIAGEAGYAMTLVTRPGPNNIRNSLRLLHRINVTDEDTGEDIAAKIVQYSK